MTVEVKERKLKIPEGWEVRKLGDIAEINPESVNKKTFKFNIIEYLDTSSIKEGKFKKPEKIPLEQAPSRAKRLVKEGDIIFSTVRPNQKHYGLIKSIPENLVVSTGFAVIRLKNAISRYVYYFITQERIINYLSSIAEGSVSAYPSIKPSDIANLDIILPPLPEQEKIAEILGSIDDQIENLTEQNKTLEEIAKTIFKRWFIDFEFPNEEGKPYKSSGGEFVDRELGKIPKGWEIVYLKDEFKFERGIEPGSKYYIENPSQEQIKQNELIPFYRVKDLETKSNVYIPKEVSKNKLAKYGDVLVSFDGTIGKVNAFLEGSFSSGIRKIRSDKYHNAFIYFLIKSDYIQNLIKKYVTGTTILHASKSINYLYFFKDKENKVINKYIKLIKPIFNNILNNQQQIQTLTQLRDTLLPKLITGQIRVKV